MVEPILVLDAYASKESGNFIEYVDSESDISVLQALKQPPKQSSNGNGAAVDIGDEEPSEKAESSLRRVGVFVAAVACAVVSVFDPSRINLVESAPANKSSSSPPSTTFANSQGGSRRASSNTGGQRSASSRSDSGDSSSVGSSSGGLGGRIGSGGSGGGGGGGGSDGDDHWGKLPDEPSDGFGVGDPRGITIVVAAVSLIGATLMHFFRRGKSNRQEVVTSPEEIEDPKPEEPEEVIHNEVRGGCNTSIEIPEPLRDLRDKQVALCVTPGRRLLLTIYQDSYPVFLL